MIRTASLNDLQLLAQLHGLCFADNWPAESFGKLLATPGGFALVAEEGGIACGFALARTAGGESEILSIGVLPDFRGHGIGRAMAAVAAHEAALAGAHAMFLEVALSNAVARALYARLGFAEVGRRKAYYKDGSDALTLKAALPLAADMGNPPRLD